MSCEEKSLVGDALQRAGANSARGSLCARDLKKLAGRTRVVNTQAEKLGISASDLVWSWVGDMIRARDPIVDAGVERTERDGTVSMGWHFHALQRSGWGRRVGMTEEL